MSCVHSESPLQLPLRLVSSAQLPMLYFQGYQIEHLMLVVACRDRLTALILLP
jgi:hypothetical protein